MPLNLPGILPAVEALKKENIFVIERDRAASQDIRPLRIAVLNLMPLKITTETDLIRLLSNTPLQVELTLMCIKNHVSKNTPAEHLDEFYQTFEDMKNQKYDGLIVTGAPLEKMDYEDVSYWDEIQEILDWAKTHVFSSLFICWASQAALYHYYGVPKVALDHKLFGVFEHKPLRPLHPIFRGFDDTFYVPHSRFNRSAPSRYRQGTRIEHPLRVVRSRRTPRYRPRRPRVLRHRTQRIQSTHPPRRIYT